ncbi:MAG: 4Fe-4S dicluster domain-containing protein [Deltaproteobacteria bacterium]|nr:4Fe-4S dicluster domain-containing protein [Deltaproteobacteria bacterium]MBW2044088.1 4Fe-4S dicluster domain-containing protein [Deltaproteobacteria bacterium]MBW2301476.1 4Fe-4S dicluster domain-containing protein [Deltaproteobacteria bacterium]
MARFGMVIDLNKCVRCRTCYVACKKEHNILAFPKDEMHPYEYYRLRYVEWEQGSYPMVRRSFIPIQCVQCDDPICIRFCPVDAIMLREGLIKIDRNRCNGCGVCTNICPYGALYIDRDGKADGCDFCAERLDAGLVPVCVEMCSGGARIFGDLDSPDSKISKTVKSASAKSLVIKSQVNRRIFYIPSPNETDWDELEFHEGFKNAMDRRKRDLPPVRGIL